MQACRASRYTDNAQDDSMTVEDCQRFWREHQQRCEQEASVQESRALVRTPQSPQVNIERLAMQRNSAERMPLNLQAARRIRRAQMPVYTRAADWSRFVHGNVVTDALRNSPCFRTDHPDAREGYYIGRGLQGIPQWILRCLPDFMRYFASWAREICKPCV